MKQYRASGLGLLLPWLSFTIALFGTPAAFAQQSSAEGTWRLVSRKLPNGTTVTAPNVMGVASWVHGQRSSNIFWRDPNGAAFSSSLVSTYKLTATEYTETLMYMVYNDPTTGQPAVVDLSGETKSAHIRGGPHRVEMKLPFDPVTIVVVGNILTATSEGGFVDSWTRVD